MPPHSREIKSFYPLIFAVIPALGVYANNWRIASIGDGLMVFLGSALLGGCVWGALGQLMGKRKGALAAAWFLLLFYQYDSARDLILRTSNLGHVASYARVLILFVVLGSIGFVVVYRAPEPTRNLVSTLNVVSVAAATAPGIVLLAGLLVQSEVAGPREAAELPGGSAAVRPDVYLIVPDGYARQDTLRRLFDYDNEPFLSALEERGFFVARDSYSNYNQTFLSLSSSMNFEYLHEMKVRRRAEDAGSGRRPLQRLIGESRIRKILEGFGYLFVTFPSGSSATQFPEPDILVRGGWAPSEFQNVFLSTTPIPDLLSVSLNLTPFDWHRTRIANILDRLGSLAGRLDPPIFVVAHIYLPHPPFVYDSEGQPVNPPRPYRPGDGTHYYSRGGTVEEYVRGYPQQVEYLNRRLLEAVDEIQARSDVPPVIIIQGDHGSGLYLDQEELARTDLRERFGILNAVFLPGVDREDLPSDLSPVNNFRWVLRTQFGGELPLLENRSFFAPWSRPYHGTDVTKLLVQGDGS